MGAQRYDFRAAMPDRRVFGRLTHFEELGDSTRSRTSIEFDTIDANVDPDDYDRLISDDASVDAFALVRVLTTMRRFVELTGGEPQVGDWYELQLAPRKKGVSGPIAFLAQLSEAGYISQARGTVQDIGFVLGGEPGERPSPSPQSLGAAASPVQATAAKLAAACEFPLEAIASDQKIRGILGSVGRKPAKVCVHDVGQANFVTLYDAVDRPLLHFDVGWPTPFNGRTAPARFAVPIPKVPVVISHWDFDHIHGYWRFAHLKRGVWIAPVQKLSPNSKKVAKALAASGNLMGWTGMALSVSAYIARKCSGSLTKANHSGIALCVELEDGRSVLMVGDAHYDLLGFPPRQWDSLVVTHHGANFSGVVPAPRQRHNKAYVSVGRGNVYKHPRKGAMLKHSARGWSLVQTSTGSGFRRSSIWV